ncbi:hypothetical protein [Prescottella subtropica]|uniref:hypothetical protein n=1 Tax=Prescottella subtropica TaxID=2545757 RepID=UPI0010F5A319|nr:hypothetical protein [Prescottella subtropica]
MTTSAGAPELWVDEFGDDPNMPTRTTTSASTPIRPHRGYRFHALPATAAYVPDGSYRIDRRAHVLLRDDRPVARIGPDLHTRWLSPMEDTAFTVWAQELRWIQQVPAHTSLPAFGLALLDREAHAVDWCEQQSQTALVYSTVADMRRGRWRAEPLLNADHADDLAFLTRVDSLAAYYWHRGRRHTLTPGRAGLMDEVSNGEGLAAMMPACLVDPA